ncbi:BA75_01962T0 [Komagataella pastoris]|uniref:BA75_01962T0 n=1 Tax=Komagataella pastoris TaxID=4922 RepID=A0A1B2JC90_PICPA|nr:BA75_01962T0 [Komagataella pastoris]
MKGQLFFDVAQGHTLKKRNPLTHRMDLLNVEFLKLTHGFITKELLGPALLFNFLLISIKLRSSTDNRRWRVGSAFSCTILSILLTVDNECFQLKNFSKVQQSSQYIFWQGHFGLENVKNTEIGLYNDLFPLISESLLEQGHREFRKRLKVASLMSDEYQNDLSSLATI